MWWPSWPHDKEKNCKVKLSTWECVGRSGARQISQKSTKKQGAVAHSVVYCQRSIEDPSQQSQLEIAIPDSKKIASIWPRRFSAFATPTKEQQEIMARLRHLSGEWHRFKDVTAESMGRTAGKIESLEALVQRLERSAEACAPSTGSGKGPACRVPPSFSEMEEVQVAKPVEASRLSFKGRPAFDPLPYLSEPAKSLYARPLDFARPPEECFEEVPAVKVRGHRKEVLGLLAALDATQRLALFAPADVRMGNRAGVFCLMKNLTTDRLILDCRPANILEPGLNEWTQTMGSLVPILSLVVPPGYKLLASGEDLKDYYYYYIITQERAKRNALAMQLSATEARQFRNAYRLADKNAQVLIPALATMAMGDLNSVEFGQQAHVRLGLMHGLVRLPDLLTLRGTFPRQLWAVGYVIDDFIVLEASPPELPHDRLLSTALADEMVQLYSRVGLESNAKKRFRAEENAQFWGISIDGGNALIRAQLDRVVPLCFISARVARAGVASRHLLEVIAGAWTAILQARKRGMCLLEEIFVEIQGHPYGQTFPISSTLVAELWMLTILAPLFCSDLRAPASPVLYAVDASDNRVAGVRTELPEVFSQELLRHSMTRAAWTRLLSPWKSYQRSLGRLLPEEEVPLGEEPAHAHPLWVQLARSCRFHLLFSRAAAVRTHINIKELKALLLVESHHGQIQPSTRCNVATDSQVCLGAVVKGRSSSPVLNNMLRSHLPTVLVYNLYPGHQYLPSCENPSDDPTRNKLVREPVEALPSWLQRAFEGTFDQLDSFLESNGVASSLLARLPEFSEADIPQEWFLSGRVLRRKLFSIQQQTHPQASLLLQPPSPRSGKSVKAALQAERNAADTSAAVLWQKEERMRLSKTAELALRALPESHFVFPRGWTAKHRRDSLSFAGALDLFSGSRGLARALARHANVWVLTYDIAHDPKQDLLASSIQESIQRYVDLRCFRLLTAGPVCSSFSRAVRPPVRFRLYPKGLPQLTTNMQRKVEEGNSFSRWLADLVDSALRLGLLILVENPWMSFLWDQSEWKALLQGRACDFFTTDFCVRGMPWRKRTRFFTNCALRGCKLFCQCEAPGGHQRLSGYSSKHRVPWTKVAEAYPARLANTLALFLANDLLPPERKRALNIAACAKCNLRVGEASKPGPRPKRARPELDLEQVQLLTTHTLLIQQRARSLFMDWIEQQLSEQAWAAFRSRPELCVALLRAFGRHLYEAQQPLYLFRHLVVYYQRNHPSFPGPLTEAWDPIARWERVQPVEHRTPMPKMIFDALITTAWLWGWKRFAAVSLLAFHGKLRVSEPLRARRRDLLLPAETGADVTDVIQHTRISDELTIFAAEHILGVLQADEQLYPAAPATYRRRWDLILSFLRLDKSWKLTPGTLRAGGAVHAYHQGQPVTEILWLMRLKSLNTLESYLQSTAAMNIMLTLPPPTRARIRSFAQLQPFIVRYSP